MIDLRETAKEIVDKYIHLFEINDSFNAYDLTIAITKDLEAAYKQGAMSRVDGPSDDDIRKAANLNRMRTNGLFSYPIWIDACNWYRDSMKITPLTADAILPSEADFMKWFMYDKGAMALKDAFNKVRDFVVAKLEQGLTRIPGRP